MFLSKLSTYCQRFADFHAHTITPTPVQDEADAQYQLACFYLTGAHLLGQNLEVAKHLLESAAAQGHVEAQKRLADWQYCQRLSR